MAVPLVAALVVVGCASPRAKAADAALLPSRCLTADTTTTAPDTIYAMVAVTPESSPLDCERRQLPLQAVPVVVNIPPPQGTDLRDLLDGRVPATRRPDVVVTNDPTVIDFAVRSGGYLVEVLPWNTTYVLATASIEGGIVPDADSRAALARDAVRGDVRGAAEPFMWLIDAACAQSLITARPTAPPAVAYGSGDAIARAIAERMVSLAGSAAILPWLPSALGRRGATWRVLPVHRDSLATVVGSARAAAAVIAVARDPATPCGTRDNLAVPRGALPLVDARSHVLVRRGSGAAFVVGLDGALHFVKWRAP